MDQGTGDSMHYMQGQSMPLTNTLKIKVELPWSMKEEPPDQPSAVYSPMQPLSDSTSGSQLPHYASHVCQRCSAVFMLSRSLKEHMEIFHGETPQSESPVLPRLGDSAEKNTDKEVGRRRSQRVNGKRALSAQPGPSRCHSSDPIRRSNPPCPLPATPPPVCPKQPKRKKTRTEINRDYRHNILADPERGAKYLELCRLKSKLYRDNATEEQKKKVRERTRLRAKKVREIRKMAALNCKLRMKRGAEGKQPARTHAAELKRKWRANRTPQKIALDNLRRRQQRAEKKAAMLRAAATQALTSASSPPSPPVPASAAAASRKKTSDSPAARWQRLCRARKAMPSDPELYAETLHMLLVTASPNKRAALERRGISIGNHGHYSEWR